MNRKKNQNRKSSDLTKADWQVFLRGEKLTQYSSTSFPVLSLRRIQPAVGFRKEASFHFVIWRHNFMMAFEHEWNQRKRRKCVANNDLSNEKYKKKAELRELTLQDISSLSDEIHHLEEEIFKRDSLCADTYTLESLAMIEAKLLNADLPSSSKENNTDGKEKEIDVINERLRSLEKLTGLIFIENSTEMLSKTEATMVLLRRMLGTCLRIPFAVEFEVKEEENVNSLLSSKGKIESIVHVVVKFYLTIGSIFFVFKNVK